MYLFLTVGLLGGACSDVEQQFHQVEKDNKRDLRLITDFRGINKMLLHPVYPFKSTNKILESIPSENIYFAALDMLKGYFQVPLDEETSNLTVCITPWDKYKYKCPHRVSTVERLVQCIHIRIG